MSPALIFGEYSSLVFLTKHEVQFSHANVLPQLKTSNLTKRVTRRGSLLCRVHRLQMQEKLLSIMYNMIQALAESCKHCVYGIIKYIGRGTEEKLEVAQGRKACRP